jgi:hypothetical protein
MDARADNDGRAVLLRGEVGDLCARLAGARLRLVERLLAIELARKVMLDLILSITRSSERTAPRTTGCRRTFMASSRFLSSSASFAAFSAFFRSFSASLARFFSSFLLGLCSPSLRKY